MTNKIVDIPALGDALFNAVSSGKITSAEYKKVIDCLKIIKKIR